jgi:hypothetical protein
MKRSIILPALVTAFVALSPVGVALADNPHIDSNGNRVLTGQPNKEESDLANLKPPGHSTLGFANAEQHYAGQPGTPTDPTDTHANSHAVSQYDVAGFQQCMHRSADTSIC